MPDQFLVCRQRISLIPPQFGRTDAFRAELAEACDIADAHSEPHRNFRDRRAIRRCPNYAFTQTLTTRPPHLILACLPVRFSNLIRARRGIHHNPFFSGSALTARYRHAGQTRNSFGTLFQVAVSRDKRSTARASHGLLVFQHAWVGQSTAATNGTSKIVHGETLRLFLFECHQAIS
jgi:hypothetical protein